MLIENRVENALTELKESVKDVCHEESLYRDEFYLLRWLKAGDMNVGKAEQMMRTAVKWRKEHNVSTLLEEDFPEFWLEAMPFYADALTTDGVLVASTEASRMDIREMVGEVGRQRAAQLFIQTFAKLERASIWLNRLKLGEGPLTEDSAEGMILLVDMNQFKACQIRSYQAIQLILETCKVLVKYFPYLCSKFMFVNCNKVSSILFKLVRPILESPSVEFVVYGFEKTEWEDAVTSTIPANLLRTPFGGTRPEEAKGIPRTKLIHEDLLLSYLQPL